MNMRGFRERILPSRKSYTLFEELDVPHELTATVYTYPFRHAVIDNFLPEGAYSALEALVRKRLARGLSQTTDREKFSRFELYDLYSWAPEPTLEAPLGYFFCESYFRALEAILDRPVTRDTFATFHHHEPNPKDNYIHADFVYQHFKKDPLENGVNAWYRQCDTFAPSPGSFPRVRAAAIIFYVNNDRHQGSGGETGIFAAKDLRSLVRAVAPRNNRLLVFDVTPTSFHNYRACSMPSRNSLAQWCFAEEKDVLDRFGGIPPRDWSNLERLNKRLNTGPTAPSA